MTEYLNGRCQTQDYTQTPYGTYPRKNAQNGHRLSLVNGVTPSNGAVLSVGELIAKSQQNGLNTTPRAPSNGHSIEQQQQLRGILRNKHDSALRPTFIPFGTATPNGVGAHDNRSVDSSSNGSIRSGHQSSKIAWVLCWGRPLDFGRLVDEFIKPTVVEFTAVLFSVFVVTVVEARSEPVMSSAPLVRVVVVSITEGLCLHIFLVAFRRVNLSPLLTLGCLFTASTNLLLCLLYWLVQIAGALLAVYLYQLISSPPSQFPLLFGVASKTDWLQKTYQMVLCQAFSSFIIVLSYLVCTDNQPPSQCENCDSGGNGGKTLGLQNPSAVSCAVIISSVLSGVLDPDWAVPWNPARTFASACVGSLFGGSSPQWSHHYVLWLGPLIGSLFASFLYRIIFANRDKRICGSA